MAGELPKAASGEIKYVQRSASPSKVTRGLGNDFSEGYELGITDNEEDVQETVEDWITRLRNQVTAFSQLPVDVELVRPEFPSMSDTAVSRISSTCAVPVTAEFGPERNTYVRECVRQNTLLEEQNVLLRNQNTLLKDIREKPVIQDSDVFSSYQRSQRSYFAATGRTGISGVD